MKKSGVLCARSLSHRTQTPELLRNIDHWLLHKNEHRPQHHYDLYQYTGGGTALPRRAGFFLNSCQGRQKSPAN
jgi:hypothetical protein